MFIFKSDFRSRRANQPNWLSEFRRFVHSLITMNAPQPYESFVLMEGEKKYVLLRFLMSEFLALLNIIILTLFYLHCKYNLNIYKTLLGDILDLSEHSFLLH